MLLTITEFHEWGSIIANRIRVIRPFVVFVFKNKRGWLKANLSIYFHSITRRDTIEDGASTLWMAGQSAPSRLP
jgi:hypothetical protein